MMRNKVLKIYFWGFLIGLIYAVLVMFVGLEIRCFYYETLGLKCPGCGLTRMFVSMIKLDFASAFNYNPVMFVMFFVWNLIGVLCFWNKFKFISNPKVLYGLLWVSIIIVLIYAVLRNQVRL